MSWSEHPSGRRATLPPGWPAIRGRILARDGHLCRIQDPGCLGRATDVDHTGDPHDHRDEQLRAACSRCHGTRSAGQGGTAAGQARRRMAAARRRPPEAHPGLIPPPPRRHP